MKSRNGCPSPWWRGFNSAADLKNLRRLSGLSQDKLARLTGFERHAVVYHEKRKGRVDGVAPRRFREAFEALGYKVPGWREPPVVVSTNVNIGAPSPPSANQSICGARTRKGEPCQCKPLKPGGRCKFHGGMSTGPKTPEGIARIVAARRARAERERMLPEIRIAA